MKRLLALLLAVAMCISFAACGNSTVNVTSTLNDYEGNSEDMKVMDEQLAKYVADPESLPISYNYDGTDYKGLSADASSSTKKVGDVTTTTFTDKVDNVTITIECKKYEKYPVIELVGYFKNEGKDKSKIFDGIKIFDGNFTGSNGRVIANSGDYNSEFGYKDQEASLFNGFNIAISPTQGRSCNEAFPYQKIIYDEYGFNVAIGWSGVWETAFLTYDDVTNYKVGQKRCHTYIDAGETYRTPSVTMMAYTGDEDHGNNVWRKFYYDHILPVDKGTEKLKGMTVYNQNALPDEEYEEGDEFTKSTEENQLKALSMIEENNIKADLWWIDAGWYEITVDEKDYPKDNPAVQGKWPNVGTWEVDSDRFPNGLKPIGEKCEELGMDFLVWFEPERVKKGTQIYNEHPDWILHADEVNYADPNTFLLDLTNQECVTWLCEHISNFIKDNKITWYREDFNMSPEYFWIDNETEDRVGMVENVWIQNFYYYWDYLLENNPGLNIDSCSSGGRRNDIETMKRAVPLHHTDFGYGYKPICQAFNETLSKWIPYYKPFLCVWDDTGSNYNQDERVDLDTFSKYSFINNIGPMMAIGWPSSIVEDKDRLDYVNNVITPMWEKASPIMLYGDFYAVSPADRESTGWTVHEWYDVKSGKGVIKSIANSECDIGELDIALKGIDADATYKFTNDETGDTFEMKGSDAMENITLEQEAMSGAIWFFEKK